MSKEQIINNLPLALYHLIILGIGYGVAYIYNGKRWGIKIIITIIILAVAINNTNLIYAIHIPSFLIGFCFFHRYKILDFLENIVSILLNVIKKIFGLISNLFCAIFIPFNNLEKNNYNQSQQQQEENKREEDYKKYEETIKNKKRTEETQEEQQQQQKEDPYKIFDLPQSATLKEIEARFKALVKSYHPDRFEQAGEFHKQENQEKMKKINWAYGELKKRFQNTHLGKPLITNPYLTVLNF